MAERQAGKATPAGGYKTGEWRPSVSPWIITISVMLATFMEVLDTTIVTVAVPHIAGSLSASTDQATWVLTSYLVSNAIVLPASGWLSIYFGRKRFLVVCIVIFTLASIASGVASSLQMLVIARVFQGAGGGALQPVSQAILLESFPPEKRGMAMAAFAIGVVLAPILGPTVGGWLTDNYSWRWAFYINIPIGILAIMMIRTFVDDPPYIREARPGRIDFTGFGLMAIGLAALQIILDKGQEADWFAAPWIRWFAAISATALILFIIWELRAREPIVHLRVFADRNFAVGTLLMTCVGIALYSAISLIPLFLQVLLRYPALQSGLAVSPRGIGALVMMPVVGYLTDKIDFRKLIGTGFVIVAISLWLISRLSLETSAWNIGLPSILTGVGLSMVFVPLSAVAMGTLPQNEIGNASGVFNLMRNVGGSTGVSLLVTYQARHAQKDQAVLVSRLSPWNLAYQFRRGAVEKFFASRLGPAVAHGQAQGFLYRALLNQAQLVSFVQSFRLLTIVCVGCVAGAFFLKRIKPRRRHTGH
ncbi:MAG: DHA2 family efflux MFS transporter permease subunit [Actinomycetota bacterium]|nr:DHA2 family efflux MFS transporter permease subunit [Actinomycetota bacterium]